ncbi:secreted protein, partial [gut metagenome]
MKKGWTYLGLGLLAFFLTACIRQDIDDCPPLRVQIAVKDKNYENIDFVE